MKISGMSHQFLSSCVMASMLAGCGGSQSSINPPSARAPAITVHPDRSRSWMSPEAQSNDLLYVSDGSTTDLYTYPHGNLLGSITGLGGSGLCVKKTGDVYTTDFGTSQVFEFAHGGTIPIKTLNDPGGYPIGCSVDPSTGNLAVANYQSIGSGPGNVVIYAKAKGSPKTYTDIALLTFRYCGYDNAGNLFVDGQNGSGNFQFAELPKGKNAFTNITLSKRVEFPGGVQWDGTYVAVGDGGRNSAVIYRVQVSGSKGKVKGSTPLGGAYWVLAFWIQGTRVIGANYEAYPSGFGNVMFWNYPAGGTATKTITGLGSPSAVTVSLSG